MRTHNFIFRRLIIGLVGFLLVNNSYSQWPQWRGPDRNGISKEAGLLKVWPQEGPRMVWSIDTVGDGFSSTAIQNQVVYTTGKRDTMEILTAIDLKGNLKWQRVLGRASREKEWPQSRCTPTVYKNKVYAVTVFGDVACFDSKSGNQDWKMPAFENFGGKGYNIPAYGVSESPLIVDDKLIITPCGNNTTMVALDRLTGKTIWKSESLQDTNYYCSPVIIPVSKKKLIFTSTTNYDILVESSNGKIIWKDSKISGMIPLVNGNQVYFTGENKKGGTMYIWNEQMNNRTVLWRDTVSANQLGGAVLFNNKIIIPGNIRGLVCLDSKTGKMLSHYDRISYSTLLVADNMLYCYEDRSGKIFLFRMEGDNLVQVSSFKITEGTGPRIAHLAISDGLLFIRHGKVLMAYDVKQRS